MRFYEVSFFCDAGSPPKASISLDPSGGWPITVRITSSGKHYEHPCITLYIQSEKDLVEFRDSLVQAYEELKESSYDS